MKVLGSASPGQMRHSPLMETFPTTNQIDTEMNTTCASEGIAVFTTRQTEEAQTFRVG